MKNIAIVRPSTCILTLLYTFPVAGKGRRPTFGRLGGSTWRYVSFDIHRILNPIHLSGTGLSDGYPPGGVDAHEVCCFIADNCLEIDPFHASSKVKQVSWAPSIRRHGYWKVSIEFLSSPYPPPVGTGLNWQFYFHSHELYIYANTYDMWVFNILIEIQFDWQCLLLHLFWFPLLCSITMFCLTLHKYHLYLWNGPSPSGTPTLSLILTGGTCLPMSISLFSTRMASPRVCQSAVRLNFKSVWLLSMSFPQIATPSSPQGSKRPYESKMLYSFDITEDVASLHLESCLISLGMTWTRLYKLWLIWSRSSGYVIVIPVV